MSACCLDILLIGCESSPVKRCSTKYSPQIEIILICLTILTPQKVGFTENYIVNV